MSGGAGEGEGLLSRPRTPSMVLAEVCARLDEVITYVDSGQLAALDDHTFLVFARDYESFRRRTQLLERRLGEALAADRREPGSRGRRQA